VDVQANSEDNMPENDIEESPFHISSVVQYIAPFRQAEKEVNSLPVIPAEEPNTVRGIAWVASQRPANRKVQCKNKRYLSRDCPRDCPRDFPALLPETAYARRLPKNRLPRQSPLNYRNTKGTPVEYIHRVYLERAKSYLYRAAA
jgi:hypothetical protein